MTNADKTLLDPCAGSGKLLIKYMKKHGFNPRNTYYNDNDPIKYENFIHANRRYGLEIPEENITCSNFLEWGTDMRFDVIVGNPPYSLAGSKTGKKGRAKNLYPEFYKIAIEIADQVYMIVPNTSRQNYGSFNSFIRKHTNKIIPIEDGVFDVNISTWCLIKDGSGTNVNDIDWADLHELPDQKVKWAKGKVNVTTESDLLEDIGGDYTVFHKINGKGLHQSATQSVPKKKLFPSHGYAVIMPQQIQNHGWTDTAIVKCNGRQAATNGVNLAFVETIKEAEYLVEYMKSPNFVSQALSFCGGMRNMTLSAMRKINMDDYRY